MKNLIKNLLSSSNDASHKRLIAIGSFLVLVGMVVLKAKSCPVDSTLVYVFAALTGGQSSLSVLEKIINR